MKSQRRSVHRRWIRRVNRDISAPDSYRDEWRAEQCLACWHFVPLAGTLGKDFGACTNAESPFDQRVMFEHDGCEAFEPRPGGS